MQKDPIEDKMSIEKDAYSNPVANIFSKKSARAKDYFMSACPENFVSSYNFTPKIPQRLHILYLSFENHEFFKEMRDYVHLINQIFDGMNHQGIPDNYVYYCIFRGITLNSCDLEKIKAEIGDLFDDNEGFKKREFWFYEFWADISIRFDSVIADRKSVV